MKAPLPRFQSGPAEPLTRVTAKLRAALNRLAAFLSTAPRSPAEQLTRPDIPVLRPPPPDLKRGGRR